MISVTIVVMSMMISVTIVVMSMMRGRGREFLPQWRRMDPPVGDATLPNTPQKHARHMAHNTQRMAHGARHMAHATWHTAHGTRHKAHDT